MLNGFPDRPLSYQELEVLSRSDAIGFVFPATPNSLDAASKRYSYTQWFDYRCTPSYMMSEMYKTSRAETGVITTRS